jgi:hypothetical protein
MNTPFFTYYSEFRFCFPSLILKPAFFYYGKLEKNKQHIHDKRCEANLTQFERTRTPNLKSYI